MHIPGEDIEKNVAEFGKDVAEDLVRPTAQSIGDNLGLFVDGIMGWLGYIGEKQKVKRQAYIDDYKRKINQKVENIPKERLVEPKIRIFGPAIEASKYFIEEEECREMFANLLASACDLSDREKVHPSFPNVISQLSPLDAKFISSFVNENTFPAVYIRRTNIDGSISPCPLLFIDFKDYNEKFSIMEKVEITKSAENLQRLGLLIFNDEVVELGYNYESFRIHELAGAVINGMGGENIHFKKFRLELSEFGKDFVKTCVAK